MFFAQSLKSCVHSLAIICTNMHKLLNHRMHSHLRIRQPICHSGVRKDFCKTTVVSVSLHLMMRSISFRCQVAAAPTFEWVLMTWRWVDQHEFGPILLQDLVVLPYRLIKEVGRKLVLHIARAGHQDALHNWQKVRKKKSKSQLFLNDIFCKEKLPEPTVYIHICLDLYM